MSTMEVLDSRPPMLMISHCVPNAKADVNAGVNQARTRAWQLLESVSTTHRVILACVCQGPFSLQQWRALQSRCHRVAVEPAGRDGIKRAMGQVISDQKFDAVLSTHASLASLVRHIPCRIQVVDLFAMSTHQSPRRAIVPGSWRQALSHMWQDRHLAQDHPRERRIAQTADAVLVDNLTQRHQLLPTAKNIVVYPIDPSAHNADNDPHSVTTGQVDPLAQLVQPVVTQPVHTSSRPIRRAA